MNDRTHNTPPAEDYRITLARQMLAESKAAGSGEISPARWWGRMENTVEQLLAAIDAASEGRS
jgi:hypothetical protein